MSTESQTKYSPPSYPPPKKPLLKPETALRYPINLEELAWRGWTTLTIANPDQDPLYRSYSELFKASADFFDLPEENRLEYQVPPQGEFQVSEEGYSRVEGEKCMITLRKSVNTPKEFGLRGKAEDAWRASGEIMFNVLVAIEESLGMKPGTLSRTADYQLSLPQEGARNVATLMRLFRYDRPVVSRDPGIEVDTSVHQGDISRTVAEPHKDLGLLTIVVGHTPGLECWDPSEDKWVSCEIREGLNVSILVGQTLATFTNGRFSAGRHRVFVHPFSSPSFSSIIAQPDAPSNSPLANSSYRYSIVHALRGHLPTCVSYDEFETPITGPYPSTTCFRNVSIAEIYKAISNAHYNINISIEERRRQERQMRELKEKEIQFQPEPSQIPTKPLKANIRIWVSKLRGIFQ